MSLIIHLFFITKPLNCAPSPEYSDSKWEIGEVKDIKLTNCGLGNLGFRERKTKEISFELSYSIGNYTTQSLVHGKGLLKSIVVP